MAITQDNVGRTTDPNPSHAVHLDYPTLGRLVEAEAQDLDESAKAVYAEVLNLVRDHGPEPTGAEAEAPCTPDELIAQLNGIGSSAYRLARHVRTLVEFQALHLAHQAETEAIR